MNSRLQDLISSIGDALSQFGDLDESAAITEAEALDATAWEAFQNAEDDAEETS